MPPTNGPQTRQRLADITEPTQLLVEGKDGLNWFRTLLQHMGIGGVQVQNYRSVSELRSFLQMFARAPGFVNVTAVGIVRDAETNPGSDALASVRGALENAGLPAPSVPDTIAAGPPRVSVLILPDGANPGMLESLLGETVRGTPVADCIDEFLKCAERDGGSEINRPEKAFAHAFLATRPDPHVSVGVAAQKGYWDLDHAALDGVRSFLSSLALSSPQ
ncbi:MAG: hypothetical protein OXQ94_17705 [Gemmatimonadota bacterium]|nr:hypothetical protein [Gemmatimonadota bacterium]